MKFKMIGLLLLIGSLSLYCQMYFNLHDFEPEINDARAEALGKTSLLSSSGANYLFNNPAMLSKLESQSIRINGRSIIGKSEIDHAEYDYPFQLKLSSIALGLKPRLDFADQLEFGFGAGFRTYYDDSFKIEYDGSDGGAEYAVQFNGGFNTMVLGLGADYQEKYQFGMTLSFAFLSNLERRAEKGNTDNDFDVTKKGTFFTFSGNYIVNENFSMSARIRTAYILEFEYDYMNTEYNVEDVEIEIPLEFIFASKISINPKFNIFLEYGSRNLGDYYTQSDLYTGNVYNSENGFSFRSGIEFGKELAIRGGFFIQSVPLYKVKAIENMTAVLSEKPLNQMGFTGGMGIFFNKNVKFDLFASYLMLNYTNKYNDENQEVKRENSFMRFKMGFTLGYDF